jgi:hypothetical protein
MGYVGGMGNNKWGRRENWKEMFEGRRAANGFIELNLGGDSEGTNLLFLAMKCGCKVR